ncbi:MAG TPA: CshA/CshB family fibrillar adhesin-related protein [Puia sp.]|jgi:gliding motility-associated-like protein|nr:CshA/CshB family fibrillar adhesin-related protein [Puia sp.]
MPRRLLLSLCLLSLFTPLFAQHADLGTGALKNQIWWINWAGVTIANGATKTVTTDDGLAITITFSNVAGREPVPAVMNTYFGAMLHLLYDFSDPAILPSLYDGPQQSGAINFTMTVSASRNGSPVGFYLVTADAEASWSGETTTLKTNGSAWQTMTFFRNSAQTNNPLTGCGTQTISIQNTFDGNPSEGQNPIITTLSPGTTPLALDVTFDHAATQGGMSLAFGLLQSEDRGDLPASYGFAQHQLLYTIQNPCNYLAPLPALIQDVTLMIGSVPGDADPIQYTDDNAIGVDEEGVSTFLVYDHSGNYTVNLVVHNTTGNDAWLTGWFDNNRNGKFDAGESVTTVIPNNATAATLTWTGLPSYLPPGTAAGYGFRFRISTEKAATQQATGFAQDGEVEDYFVTSAALCQPFTATVSPGTAICAGQPAPLQAGGGATYSWSPALGLDNPAIANPVASPQNTTTYTVTASDPQACQANAAVTITIKPIPALTISPGTAICPGSSTPISFSTPDPINGYGWTPAAGLSDPTLPNPIATPAATTTYTLTATGANNCPASAAVTITVNPQPIVNTRADTSLCGQPGILLTTTVDQPASFQWQPATGLSDPQSQSPLATPGATTNYIVTATNQYNCHSTSSVILTVLAVPVPAISPNTIICQGKPVNLQASGGNTYSWTSTNPAFAAAGSSITTAPATNTEYYAHITGADGCSIIDSVAVTVHPIPTFSVLPKYPAMCQNDTLRLSAAGGDVYAWTGAGGQILGNSSSILVTPPASTNFDVTISDDICLLSASFAIPVTVHPAPTLSITSSNTIDCTRGQATLNVNGALGYQWLAQPGITDLFSSHPIVDPFQTTTFYVIGTDVNHCSILDSITVKVDNTEALSRYPIASAFSPNHDGNNDCFGLKYWGHITSLEMSVFDRWGKRVFYTTDPQQCWDGTCNGIPQSAGGYVYQIKAATACGTAYRKGIVILVR